MVDILTPPLARPVQHARIDIRAGGSAVNAARTAVALGRTAAVVGCVGDDALGRLLRGELAADGVEDRLTLAHGERTGRLVAVGETIVAERGAKAALSPADVGTVDAAAVLVSGYQLFRDDSGPATQLALEADGVVGIDVGAAGLVESFGVERARSLVRRGQVVFGNDDVMRALDLPPGTLAVTTHGPHGASAGNVTFRPEHVLDGPLLGAGDAFAAGFLLEY